MKLNLFDTHIHFFDSRYQQNTLWTSDYLINLGNEQGIKFFCNVGVDLTTSKQALATAQKHRGVFAACGYHPTMVNDWNQDSETELIKLLQDPRMVAIGEIGLDFYHKYTSVTMQKEILHKQLLLAQRLKKPVLLHIRNAYWETWEIVAQYQVTGIVHCFSGTLEQAKLFIQKGFYISFSGVLTFTNAHSLQQIACQLPLTNLVLETDAPYLTPMPFRGQVNLPPYLSYTAQKLADLKGITYQEVVNQTTQNALQLFQINN